MSEASPTHAVPIEQLLQQSANLWRGREHDRAEICSTGFDALDAALPGGGWPLGTLIELAPALSGIGEFTLPFSR